MPADALPPPEQLRDEALRILRVLMWAAESAETRIAAASAILAYVHQELAAGDAGDA